MKSNLQNLFLVVSRQLLIISIIQVIAIQFIIANPSSSQSLEEVKISLNINGATLSNVLNEIEQETDFQFAYNLKVSNHADLIKIKVKNRSLREVLEKIAAQTAFNFKRINNNIYVIEREGNKKENPVIQELQEEITITGKVTEASTNEPLPGASVIVVGTTTGTITDVDGKFKLTIPSNYKEISVSFTGFQTAIVNIENQSIIEVALEEDFAQLDELVVMGYNTQKKRDVTGSVATVNAEEIKSIPTSSVDKMLDGRMAGVQVLTDNAPGGNVTVRVRGYGTINNNDPLYIIDGIPVSNGMNSINPQDIESIQVLKDAAAASIYGSRAANGVVVITTKQGGSEESVIEFDAYAGVQKAYNLPKMLSAQGYGDMLWQATKNDGGTPSSDIYGDDPNQAVIPGFLDDGQVIPSADVDWVQEIFNPATVQSYNLSVSKGNESGRHVFSLGYYNQEGIIKHTGFDRITARFNSSYKIKDLIEIGENFSGTYSRTTDVGINSSLGSITYDAFQFPSIVPVKDNNGVYAGNPINDIGNPMRRLDRGKDHTDKRIRLLGNVFAGLDLGDLKLKTNLGIDFNSNNYRNFSPIDDNVFSTSSINSLSTGNSFNYQFTWSNTLTYQKDLGDHNFDVLIGQESIEYYGEGFSASRQSFLYEDPNFWYLSNGTDNQLNSGSASDWSLLSFFGKVNYSFLDKYLFSATLRRDGTSRLSENNWGTFPAFSAGWIISEEAFFDVAPVSSLKLRASWGNAGNQQVPSYSTLFSYQNNATYSNYAIDGAQESVYTGLVQTRVANPNLKWEVTTQTSVGLDLGLFDNKLDITAEYFNKVTDDILVYTPIPLTYGGTSDGTWTNGGQMKNSGLELTVNYKGHSNEFNYNVGFNLTAYKNELTELEGVSYLGIPSSSLHGVNFGQEISRSTVGQPIGSFYGYESAGIFKTQTEVDAHGIQPNAQPGDLIFNDVDGDGDLDTDDRTFIGSPHPDLILGVNMSFYYKGFDLGMLFNGSFGNDIYNLTKYKTEFFNQAAYNKSETVLDAWTPENPGSEIPRLSLDDPNNNIRVSSYYVEDGSYFKLYNLQLGYTFPGNKLKGLDLRLYGQVNNVFTITGYDGMSPELGLQNYSSSNRNLDIGIDRGIYPPSRTFTMGLNVKF
ncbi:SusC/RagA family TonB-linked outer membrane protein [Flexithrix dorotheae]|uniref:SusC/RagA family TonB-linked outer membrane protein n=1 Tax=Flexithrix dorotheae TaxID=70993 RepID=UPI00036530CE|nr:TonB-dependent receptor [Flexithrix dorotheae]